ncbi:MAG TPA: hypothetical protein VGH56_03990 [Solirubrobacteraceae bacterium]|jgi:hypothetical protein
MSDGVEAGTIRTKIPARLDRLPWSRSHWMVIVGLGAVMMILGGLAELVFGVKAEGKSLEQIAKPLTVEDSRPGAAAPAPAG